MNLLYFYIKYLTKIVQKRFVLHISYKILCIGEGLLGDCLDYDHKCPNVKKNILLLKPNCYLYRYKTQFK